MRAGYERMTSRYVTRRMTTAFASILTAAVRVAPSVDPDPREPH
jgi:hypothetical protein